MEATQKVVLCSTAASKSTSYSFQFSSGYYTNTSLFASPAINIYFILGTKQSLELPYGGLACAKQIPQPKACSLHQNHDVFVSEGNKQCGLISASWIIQVPNTERLLTSFVLLVDKKSKHKTTTNPVYILLLPTPPKYF